MVLPFELSLAPRTFMKCMDVALSPLGQMGVRVLDDWLILAQSEAELIAHRSHLLSHLERLGLRIIFALSSLSPSQQTSHFRKFTGHTVARGFLQSWSLSPTQSVLKDGLVASASSVLQLGLLHMRPLQYWLKPQIPPHALRYGRIRIRVSQACVKALAPCKDPQWFKQGMTMSLIRRRKVVSTDASNTRRGALCEGRPTFSS